MRIRSLIRTIAIASLVLFALSACEITAYFWTWPQPEPEPEEEFDGLEFSLEWTESDYDVPHLYMTYPAPDDWDTTNNSVDAPTFTEPYLAPTDGGDLGFDPIDVSEGIPDESTDVRGAVYYGDQYSTFTISGDPAIEMTDIEDTSELIIVRGFPFTSSSTYVSTTGGGITGLPAGSYTWVGVMEVYAYATTGQLSYADGSGVDAVLNVFNEGESFAVYELPGNTDLKGAPLVRINCFYDDLGYEIYQLVPDVRVIQSTTQIRSVVPDADVSDNGIVTIRRPVSE